MKILIACEFSGIVRDEFVKLGHGATSCDFLDTEKPGKHYRGDFFDIINDGWDMMIAFPPCTHLAVCGARWFKDKQKEQFEALCFVADLLGADIPKIALENPIGVISTRIRKPDQIIQPWQFGDPYSKKTCLWLKGLPKLKPTKIVDKGKQIKYKSGKSMPKWYADAFKLPLAERSKLRSRTFSGIAKAMAEQWE